MSSSSCPDEVKVVVSSASDHGDGASRMQSSLQLQSDFTRNVRYDRLPVSEDPSEADELKIQNAELAKLLARKEEELQARILEIAEKEKNLTEARKMASITMSMNSDLTTNLTEKETMNNDLKRENEKLRKDLCEKESEITKLSKRCSQLEKVVEAEKHEHEEKQLEYKNQQHFISNLLEELKKAKSDLTKCQEKMNIVNTANEILDRQLAKIERQNKAKLEGMSVTKQQKEISILKESLGGKQELEIQCKKYQDFVSNLLYGFKEITEILEASVQGSVGVNCDGDNRGTIDRRRLEVLCTGMGKTLQELQSNKEQRTEELEHISSNLKRLLKRLTFTATQMSLFQESLEKIKSLGKRVKELEVRNYEQKDKIDELEKSVEEKERGKLEAEMKWRKVEKRLNIGQGSSVLNVRSISSTNCLLPTPPTTPSVLTLPRKFSQDTQLIALTSTGDRLVESSEPRPAVSDPEPVNQIEKLSEDGLTHCNTGTYSSTGNQSESILEVEQLETHDESHEQQSFSQNKGEETTAVLHSTENLGQTIPSTSFDQRCPTLIVSNESQNKVHGEVHHPSTSNSEVYYYCLCAYWTAHRYELNRHINYHTGERKFACQVCNKRFINESRLRGHEKCHNLTSSHRSKNYEEKNTSTKHLRCKQPLNNIQGQQQRTGERSSKRLKTNSPVAPQVPEDTIENNGISDRDIFPLTNPISINHELEATTGTSSTGNVKISQHRADHSKGTKCHICICGKTFSNKKCLRSHISFMNQVCRFSCKHCNVSFKAPCDLKIHLLKIHHEKLVGFGCRICGKILQTRKKLAQHQKSESCSRGMKNDEATQLQMTFPQTSTTGSPQAKYCTDGNLKHAKTQTEIREQFFTLREKFPCKQKLNVHIPGTNAKFLKKKIPCNIRQFTSLRRTHTVPKNMTKVYFGCQVCEQWFKNMSSLRQHRKKHFHQNSSNYRIKIHSGSRPDEKQGKESSHVSQSRQGGFQSKVLKATKAPSNVLTVGPTLPTNSGQKDIRTLVVATEKTSEREFACSICEEHFPFFSVLKRHLLRKHKLLDTEELASLKYCKKCNKIFYINRKQDCRCYSKCSHHDGGGPETRAK